MPDQVWRVRYADPVSQTDIVFYYWTPTHAALDAEALMSLHPTLDGPVDRPEGALVL